MDWRRYKQLCDRPDVFSRWMLEQTAVLLEALGEAQLKALLDEALGSPPLPKPGDHRGGPAVDMFVLQLETHEAERIGRAVARANREGLRSEATRRRGLGGFVEAWEEYRGWLPQA